MKLGIELIGGITMFVKNFVREVRDIANFYADKFEYTGDFI